MDLTHLSSPHLGIETVGTMVQIIPGLHRIQSIMDMRQVREHPDSTISKVLTVIKWRTITMLNRKLLEKQRVQNRFASDEVHIGHFFFRMSMLLSVLETV